ncbi:MAG: hypothetical protein ABI851_10015 [Saprospiraceae bacterium]
MKKLLFILLLTNVIQAQNLTWSADIASTIYTKCTSCHRSGGIAPFTLESYEETVSNKTRIQNAVSNESMPPWPPDQTYSKFAHSRSLSSIQKSNLLSWLNTGTIRGELSKEPPLPIFPVNGDLEGTPDKVLTAPIFNIKATNDIYQCFVLKNTETIDRFISAMEVIPGNRNAVHHVLIFYDKTGQARNLDNASQEPGYLSFGGIGVNGAELIGAWVPGSTPQKYPKGMGVKLPANGDIVLQIHYPRSSDGQMDQTMLKIFYSKDASTRQVFISPILNHDISLTNGPLIIPANTVKTFNAEYLINNLNITLLSVAPHMHLIGKSIEVYAQKPNKEIQNLIKINDWDFHWQGYYSFPKPIILNSGTKLLSKASYDNTKNNPNNPNSPPKLVSLGESTTDEMMLVYFTFLLYKNGDENIIIDSSFFSATKDLSEAEDEFNIIKTQNSGGQRIELSEEWNNSILSIYSLDGKMIQRRKLNSLSTELFIDSAESGLLIFQLEKGNNRISKKLFVTP